MRLLSAIAGIATLSALISGCSHSGHESKISARVSSPAALVVDTIISGVILGEPLRHPNGLAIDSKGNLIITDGGNNRVLRLLPTLVPDREIGGFGTVAGLFSHPGYLCTDGAMGVQIVDQGNRRICRLDSRFQYIDQIEFSDIEDPLKFGTPAGAALDRGGNMWVTDREKHRVAVFNAVKQFDRFVGEYGYSGDGMSSPEKVIVVRNGSHIVCDAGNRRLSVFDEYGNFEREIADPEFQKPVAATTDSAGRVWVVDEVTSRVYVFALDGTRLFSAGPELPGGKENMASLLDIAASGSKIFIADAQNDRVLVCHVVYAEQ